MIERLNALLNALGHEVSPELVADILWLAPRIMPDGETTPVEPAEPSAEETVERSADPAPPRAEEPESSRNEPIANRNSAYYGAVASRNRTAATTSPARVPTVRAIPDATAIARGLRPLKQRTASRWHVEIDVAATVAAIAESGIVDVILRPVDERWLDLVLVVDDGLSMTIWQQTVDELKALLSRLGAFRDIRVRSLSVGEHDNARSQTLGAAGPTVALVVSDCVGPAWRTGAAQLVLAEWGRRMPVAVVQPLPPRLWSGAGLASQLLQVRGHERAERNSRLSVRDPLAPTTVTSKIGLPVPVLELGAASMRRWAQLVSRTGSPVRLPILDASAPSSQVPLADDGRRGAPHLTADEQLGAFRAAASPGAYRLAAYLAAISPLTLPVMRVVQHTLPETTRTHLAEVFLGGLLRRGEDHGAFDFQHGVRTLLLDTLAPEDAYDLISAVGTRIRSWSGGGPEAPALRAGAAGTIGLPPGARPFAVSGAPLFDHLGVPDQETAVVGTASFEPDSMPSWIAAPSYEVTPLWDIDAGTTSWSGAEFGYDLSIVKALTFTADGLRLVSSGRDGIVRVRDGATGALVKRLVGPFGGADSLAVGQDGTRLATQGSDGRVRIWDVASGELIRTVIEPNAWEVAVISLDGRRTATGDEDGTVSLWDVASGESLVRMLPAERNRFAFVKTASFSPDSTWIATGGYDGKVQLWDVSTRAPFRMLSHHNARVSALAMTPDNRMVISGSDDGEIRVWTSASGALIHVLSGHRARVASFAVGPDGAWLASGGDDHTVRVWRLADGTPVTTLDASNDVYCCCWSPDGTRLAIGGDHMLLVYTVR